MYSSGTEQLHLKNLILSIVNDEDSLNNALLKPETYSKGIFLI